MEVTFTLTASQQELVVIYISGCHSGTLPGYLPTVFPSASFTSPGSLEPEVTGMGAGLGGKG